MIKNKVILCLLIVAFGQLKAQEDKALENWHLQDYTLEKRGVNVEKAYKELLANKTPQEKIIVAVIDSGIEIEHEDLKDLIWTNTDEIPNNKIDDDRNGYVDDVHGWNFLGNANGDMVGKDNLEVTRLYHKYHQKFADKTISDLSKEELSEWKTYQRAKNEYMEGRMKAEKVMKNYESFKAS